MVGMVCSYYIIVIASYVLYFKLVWCIKSAYSYLLKTHWSDNLKICFYIQYIKPMNASNYNVHRSNPDQFTVLNPTDLVECHSEGVSVCNQLLFSYLPCQW